MLGPGDVLTDGTTITALPAEWSSLFDADASGRVLVFAATDHGAALLVANRDGAIDRLPLRLRNTSYTTDQFTFDPYTSLDHEYLSGVSPQPRDPRSLADAASGGSDGRLTAHTALSAPRLASNRNDPYHDVDAVWVSYAGLAASGGVFVLGAEAVADPVFDVVDRSVALYVAPDGAVQHIATAGDSTLPGGPFYRFDALRVHGDRIAFSAWGSGNAILTYALGAAAPTAVLRAGDATPVGALLSPYPLGVTGSGGVYFIDSPQGAFERFLFSSQDAAIQLASPIGIANIGWGSVSDAGALLAPSDSALRVVGDAPSGGSCPHPPTLALVTSPTPTPRPGTTARPADLPFQPATCIPGTVCITVGDTAGSPGSQAQVNVWLDSSGAPIAGTQNDLLFPPLARLHDCAGNEDINKPATSFSYRDEWTRALVLSVTDTDPIPDGAMLYTCTVDIAADAAPGYYLLPCSDPRGNALPTTCADGVRTVEAPRQGDAAQVSSGNGSGGCAVQPAVRDSAWWLLMAIAMLLLRGGRARRQP